jgi:hypothetical protein
MAVFIFGGLTLCLIFFLIMVCVQCIGIEKEIIDLSELVEDRVVKLYNGEG